MEASENLMEEIENFINMFLKRRSRLHLTGAPKYLLLMQLQEEIAWILVV